MKDIKYITPEDLIEIIDTINSFDYEYQEEVPNYDQEREGIDKYFSLIDRSKTDYYPSIFDKASFLFININTHYFSNGNKRLAMTSTVFFLEKNNYTSRELSKDEFLEILQTLFRDFEINDFEGFTPIGFAMYHLAIIIASKNKQNMDFNELKDKVANFFEEVFEKK